MEDRMIDLSPRPDRERWRDGVEPTDVNGLIQARIDGRLSRRALVRRATALGIAAPVVGIALHATSDHVRGAPNPGRRGAAARLAQTVPADGPTAPAGEPREGGTIVAGLVDEPDTLNPWLTGVAATADVYRGVMQGLLRYDAAQRLQPALAEGFAVSDDGLTYTFDLRQDATWHNGEPFTPQDVIESWRMIVNPAFGAFSLLGWDRIVDVTAVDDTTVAIVTSEPFAPFLSYAAGETVLCPAGVLVQGVEAFRAAFDRGLVGTGPFRFVEWNAGAQITLARHDGYWGTRPRLDQVVVRFLPDETAQLAQLRTGEIQVASGTGALGPARVDEALAIAGVAVLEHATLGWLHLDLKHVDFLRETAVRQALDFATPSQEIVAELLAGRAIVAVADQAPGTPFHNPEIQPRPYDLEQAATLLDGAGLVAGEDGVRARDGRPLAIQLWIAAGNDLNLRIAERIAAGWTAIGVRTEVFTATPDKLWGPTGYQFTDKMTACLYTWINANDPDDMLYWHSSQIPTCPTCVGGNFPAYFFPYNFQEEIDALTEEAARETDVVARTALYFRIQELLHDQVPVIFICWEKAFPVVAGNLGGHWPSAYTRLLWNVEEWYLTAG
jgi:peptide/nickel transport system substrate-binding protein